MTLTFSEPGDFVAYNTAVKWLDDRGYSVGSMQRDDPIGIVLGPCDIGKWRNLSPDDKASLDGKITGSKRSGPVTVFLKHEPKETHAIPR